MPAFPHNRPLTDPTLSVVLPNYNHARLIGRAVGALRSSRRPPDEVFIIDDASTDDSLSVIEELATGWNAIHVLKHERNEGAIAALSRGLGESSGRYIYFAAADDWIEPDFFSSAIAMLERHPEVGLYSGEARLVDGRTGRNLGTRPVIRPADRPMVFDASEVADLLRRSDNWILTGSAVFRRDRVIEAGGFSPELGSFADGYLVRKVVLQHGFCYAPAIVATWCIFEKGLSRTTATDPDQGIQAMARALAHIAGDPTFPSWYPGLLDRRWRFAMSRIAVEARPVNRPVLLALNAKSPAARLLLVAFCRVPMGTVGRLFLLGLLWLRFRPMSLIALSRTAVARYWKRGQGGRASARAHALTEWGGSSNE